MGNFLHLHADWNMKWNMKLSTLHPTIRLYMESESETIFFFFFFTPRKSERRRNHTTLTGCGANTRTSHHITAHHIQINVSFIVENSIRNYTINLWPEWFYSIFIVQSNILGFALYSNLLFWYFVSTRMLTFIPWVALFSDVTVFDCSWPIDGFATNEYISNNFKSIKYSVILQILYKMVNTFYYNY